MFLFRTTNIGICNPMGFGMMYSSCPGFGMGFSYPVRMFGMPIFGGFPGMMMPCSNSFAAGYCIGAGIRAVASLFSKC